jgi:hypothetical protein
MVLAWIALLSRILVPEIPEIPEIIMKNRFTY